MITDDNQRMRQVDAQRLGIESFSAEVLTTDKAQNVQAVQYEGKLSGS